MSGPFPLPCPLDHLATIRPRLQPPSLIALDFDGTLTEIVDDPAAPGLLPERREALVRVARSGRRLAVISGRSVADVRQRVGVEEALYVGNHGLEIEGPGVSEQPIDAEELAGRLSALLRQLPALEGSFVEDKALTATVHVRPREDEARIVRVGDALREVVAAAGFALRRGKASWEIRPPGPTTKGDAVRRLLELTAVLEERATYVGDDVTDEDAFRALAAGVTARVGEATVFTAARYALSSPADVYAFLDAILEG